MAGDDDLSTFDRKKLALLTSLDKMGVKLPKRTVKRKFVCLGYALATCYVHLVGR